MLDNNYLLFFFFFFFGGGEQNKLQKLKIPEMFLQIAEHL